PLPDARRLPGVRPPRPPVPSRPRGRRGRRRGRRVSMGGPRRVSKRASLLGGGRRGPLPGIDCAGKAGARSTAIAPRELVGKPIFRSVRARCVHHILLGGGSGSGVEPPSDFLRP